MELNIIHNDREYNSDEYNNDEITEIIEFNDITDTDSEEIIYNKEINNITMLTLASMHCFFLSTFEGIFYWTYIVKKEKAFIMKYVQEIKLLLKETCRNFDIKIDLNKLIKNASNNNRKQNINGPLTATIGLSVILFLVTLSLSTINVLIQLKNKKYKINLLYLFILYDLYYNFIRSILPIILISIYEIMFFQIVVYTYSPIGSSELYLTLINSCTN